MSVNIGMNLSGLAYYTSEMPFLNICKNFGQNNWSLAGVTWNGSGIVGSTAPSTSGTSIISIASPCVVTWTNHNLVAGAGVVFSTTGSLPTGITAGEGPSGYGAPLYLVSATGLTANTFQLVDLNGNTVNTSGTQSGTHTVATEDQYNLYKFYLDANGYPISLTTTAGSQPAGCPQAGWNAVTMEFGVNQTSVGTKAGNYVFLYDGIGTFDFKQQGAAPNTVTSGGANRWIINMPFDRQVANVVVISTGSGSNYAKNFRLVWSTDSTAGIVGTNEALLNSGELFNPLFLNLIKPFTTVRFIDWMNVLGNTDVNWSDRTPPGWISWIDSHFSAVGAVPIEVQVALCNKLNCHGWFCMPPLANDDYIHHFADLVLNGNPSAPPGLTSGLNSNLKAYVEFGDEIWNNGAMFQYNQMAAIAHTKFPNPPNNGGYNDFQVGFQYGEAYRPVVQRAIWQTVWVGHTSRLSCVSAGQLGYVYRNLVILQARSWTYGDGNAFWNSSTPTVISSTGHGLVANQPIMFAPIDANFNTNNNVWGPGGNFPTGLSQALTYFVLASGLTTNSFQFSTTPGGSAVSLSGSSTVLQWFGWQGGGAMWPTVTITSGNPTVINWPSAHGFSPGMPIAFMGILPSGMASNANYYVMSSGITSTTFQISATPGGSALVTSGSSSNVQPYYFYGQVGQLTDAFAVAPYFGYGTPNSWTGDGPDSGLTQLFAEINGSGTIPTALTGTLSTTDWVNFTITTGQSFSANPANSSLIACTVPTSPTHTSATLFTIGTPTVVNWTAHGLAAGAGVVFSGSVPTGITAGTIYIVNLPTANSFRILDPNGNLVTTSGSQGTSTVTVTNGNNAVLAADGGNSFPFLDGYGIPMVPGALSSGNGVYQLSMTRQTSQGNIGAVVSINIATSTITLNNHGLAAGQAICFETTGTLPTGIVAGNVYWVFGNTLTTNTFQLVSPPWNGTPITLSGTQSGTQSILPVGWRYYANGLPSSGGPASPFGPSKGMLGQMWSWTYSDFLLCQGLPTGAIPMVCYEAGQSLLAGGGSQNDAINQALYEASQTDTRMGTVYTNMFTEWNTMNPNALIMNFSDIGADSSFGFWGVLQNVYQTSSTKYDALVALAGGNPLPPPPPPVVIGFFGRRGVCVDM
jgi:hypothetical protein